MKFTKMHGCGNDYVYVNGMREQIASDKKPELVRKLSDRHFGIGADGVIFINQGKQAMFEMEMYNADGSRAQMCGNGIRCVAKYVYDYGLTDQTSITIESFGSVKYLELSVGADNKVDMVRVNMGAPILEASKVPVHSIKSRVIGEEISVLGTTYKMTCVSMGNPHAVVFLNEIEDIRRFDLESVGPSFENHDCFPERTNTEFVHVIDRCCATAVAGVLGGLTDTRVNVHVLGGVIVCEWDQENNVVYMTGPAVTVFDGEVEL